MHDALHLALERLNTPRALQSTAIDGHWRSGQGVEISVRSPIDGWRLTTFPSATAADVANAVASAVNAFKVWRQTPAPVRGEFVRRLGQKLRQHKEDLACIVTWETGKIVQEALGEVQEMIDICDFAVGLSRQLYGKTIASERPRHRLMEQWHPLGPIGVITAFNFPVAVWAWNAAIALVCGDTVVWKPSEKTSLCAIACQTLVDRVVDEMSEVPPGLSNLVIGEGPVVGRAIAESCDLPLISATGSIPMGRDVAQRVATRFGRSLLELGGNNAAVVAPSADLELAIRSVVFAAVGTCGQRCTTLRRLIVHDSIYDRMRDRLLETYAKLPIGDPRDPQTLVGPLIDLAAVEKMQDALLQAKQQSGFVHGGNILRNHVPEGGVYVEPAIVEIAHDQAVVREETFAPILYVFRYETLADAIAINNGVPQGLASSIFTSDVREAEIFCSSEGSDCGIANVNIGTSGAEIGGAFGGEKETGGGRESGSDAWKFYMRRMTSTVNYGDTLPLAQGIKFHV